MSFKILFLLLCLSFHNSVFAGFMAVANVSKIHGKAVLKTATYEEKLKDGQEIAEGMELIIKNPKDFVEVKFQNGHLVRFTGAMVKAEDITPKSALFNLLKGKVFSVIKPLTQGERFSIKTRTASFEVNGTKFYIEESKKKSYLYVFEGNVSVKTANAEADVAKDQELSITEKAKELKAAPASKKMIELSNAVFKDMGTN